MPRAWPAAGVLVAGVVGCGGATPGGDAGVRPAPDPSIGAVRVVAEFLDAAGRRDHAAMAALFGTGDGPIAETGGSLGCGLRRVGSWIGLGDRCVTASEVELRMDVIAAVLAHDSHRVAARETVVGRGRPAARVEAAVVTGGRVVMVPFVAILDDGGRWLVEEVGLGALVGSRPD